MWAAVALLGAAGLAATVITRFTAEPHPSSESAAEPPVDAVRWALFAELQPVTVRNCEMQRFGETHDGGYLLCGNLLARVAAGYSYGISGYDGWGCDVATRLQVPVYRYDCFDTRQPACAADTTMHPECIGASPSVIEGRPFDTLERQIATTGHARSRVVVKIDVEGAEWDVFLGASNRVLERIDQMAVEFHLVNDPKYVDAIRRLKQFFYVANFHINNHSCQSGLGPFPAWAYEVLFVAKRLAEVDPSAPPRAPFHPLDAPNTLAVPDCQPTP